MPHALRVECGICPTRRLFLAPSLERPGSCPALRPKEHAMTTLDVPETTTPPADPQQVAASVIGILNDGAICALTSLGHELGLFETLAGLPPASSEQIADAAGLDERYVREWLGGMVTAGFVAYAP